MWAVREFKNLRQRLYMIELFLEFPIEFKVLLLASIVLWVKLEYEDNKRSKRETWQPEHRKD